MNKHIEDSHNGWTRKWGAAQGRDFETNFAETLVVPGCSKVEKAHDEGREEGESTSYGYNNHVRVQSEEKKEGESTLYGYTAYEITQLDPRIETIDQVPQSFATSGNRNATPEAPI